MPNGLLHMGSFLYLPLKIAIFSFMLSLFSLNHATDFKPIILDIGYQHDRFNTQPKDLPLSFRAYFSSFDSGDDDNGDGIADYWRIPHFVSYEMRRSSSLGNSPGRPRPWIKSKAHFKSGIYPRDNSYTYSLAFRSNNPDWYIRGHLCAKFHAWRLGENADWNTHTFFNAVPQRNKFNGGIWENLERLTDKWADKNKKIWIIVGPVFNAGQPEKFIGEPSKNEVEVAIPDALFKIVIKENSDSSFESLAFIYPQSHNLYSQTPYKHREFLVTIDEIETKTGLDFLTVLDDPLEDQIESTLANNLWN